MTRPNILVILSDQLRRQALGCYGDRNGATPNVDAMASGGVRFANSCSTYPICVPFRFTLMTGHYAHSRDVPGIKWRMSPSERTLADEFNDAGYESIYIGKWHLFGGLGSHYFDRPVPREHQGRWETWLGFEFRNAHFDTSYFVNGDPTPRPLGKYQTDGLTDLMMETIANRRDKSRPFACVLSVEPPHPPMVAPPELERAWLERDIALHPNFMVPGEHDADATGSFSRQRTESERDAMMRRLRLYYAMTENLDQNTGRIMRWLRETGLAENTIVVFVSDHGELGGSHSLDEKQYPYEESAGIPLIVSGPGVPAGRVINAPTCTEDLFPTLLGLCGIKPRERLFGADLSSVIRGDRAAPDRPGVMLEFVLELRPGVSFHKRVYRAFRSERYMYSLLGSPADGLKPWQFFDLRDDPGQMRNLVNDAAAEATIRQHHGWLRDRMAETGDSERLSPAWGFPALNP